MYLGPLGFMTGKTDLGLGGGRQHGIVLSMDLVAGGAWHVAALMFTTHPVGALAIFMAPEAGFGL
jgi:hypothetical protein